MFRRIHVASVLGATLAVFAACSPTDEGTKVPTAPVEPATQAARGTPAPGTPSGQISKVSGQPQANASAARTQHTPAELRAAVAWVGQLHTAAMRDLTQNEGRWLAGGRDQAARCRAALGVTEKYLSQLQREQRTLLGRDRHQIALRAVQAAPSCAGGGGLSILGMSPRMLLQEYQYSEEDGEPVTGAYADYLPALQSAVDNAWSSTDASNAVNSVLASASGIPYADQEVLYSAADLALSSTYYWYDYEMSGGMDAALQERYGGSYEQPVEQQMMYSVFGAMAPRWRVIGGADLMGCLAGMADKYWLSGAGPVGWKILGGACAIWGIGGSGAAWLAL